MSVDKVTRCWEGVVRPITQKVDAYDLVALLIYFHTVLRKLSCVIIVYKMLNGTNNF